MKALSEHAKAEIDRWIKKYPEGQKQSAVLAAMREVQHENDGYLTRELMDAVAEYLEMPPIAVYEVASFYSMLETEKVGRHSISVCTNISCMLNGSDTIMQHIEKKLGIKEGEST
ncbi:MAG: NAD(P)H-dependent oxidoreductase subunit E, partial [Gammaproteobacteria bacterium]